MIELLIRADGNKILERIKTPKVSMNEVGLVILKLEKMKQELINIEWDNDLEIIE